MRNLRLLLEYDGTNYHGWQRQPNLVTIQGTMEEFLRKILKEEVYLIGAGRTDAGVHAKGQVANFKTSSGISTNSLKLALNSLLPRDIVVKGIKEVPLEFHARFDSIGRTYRYLILNRRFGSAFYRNYAYLVPYRLDLESIREASSYLIGRYDFSSFRDGGSNIKNTIREVKRFVIRKLGSFLIIEIEADAFLHSMVRVIVGTLLEVGRGKYPPLQIKEILEARDRCLAGPTAPAKGLCLVRVRYPR